MNASPSRLTRDGFEGFPAGVESGAVGFGFFYRFEQRRDFLETVDVEVGVAERGFELLHFFLGGEDGFFHAVEFFALGHGQLAQFFGSRG